MLRIWFTPLQKLVGDVVKAPEASSEGEGEEEESEPSDEERNEESKEKRLESFRKKNTFGVVIKAEDTVRKAEKCVMET